MRPVPGTGRAGERAATPAEQRPSPVLMGGVVAAGARRRRRARGWHRVALPRADERRPGTAGDAAVGRRRCRRARGTPAGGGGRAPARRRAGARPRRLPRARGRGGAPAAADGRATPALLARGRADAALVPRPGQPRPRPRRPQLQRTDRGTAGGTAGGLDQVDRHTARRAPAIGAAPRARGWAGPRQQAPGLEPGQTTAAPARGAHGARRRGAGAAHREQPLVVGSGAQRSLQEVARAVGRRARLQEPQRRHGMAGPPVRGGDADAVPRAARDGGREAIPPRPRAGGAARASGAAAVRVWERPRLRLGMRDHAGPLRRDRLRRGLRGRGDANRARASVV